MKISQYLSSAVVLLMPLALRAEDTFYGFTKLNLPQGTSFSSDTESIELTEQGYVIETDLHCWVWANGTFTSLYPQGSFSTVKSISAGGTIIGWQGASGGIFFWTPAFGVDFYNPSSSQTAFPGQINSSGQAVASSGSVGTFTAFAWAGGVVTKFPLTSAASASSTGTVINNAGQIGGLYSDTTGQWGFVWKEPALAKFQSPVGSSLASVDFITPSARIFGNFIRQADAATGESRVYTWKSDVFTDLTPNGADYSRVLKVTGSEWAVGSFGNRFTNSSGSIRHTTLLYTFHNGDIAKIIGPEGSEDYTVSQITETGQVVGTFYLNDSIHIFSWSGGTFTDVTPNGASGVDIVAVTEAGRIVGTFGGRAFTWSSGVFTKILPAGATESEATKVNAAGRIIGAFRDSSNKKRAFTWSEDTLTELNPSGAQETLVSDINASGRVVGTYVNATGRRRAFTWFEGVYTDLLPDSGEAGEFIAINDSGRVILNTGQASALWAADPSDVPVVTPTPTPPVIPPAPVAKLSGKKKATVETSTYPVKGTAAGLVTKVTYRIGSAGAFKKAKGTNSWSFTAKLKTGKNKISIVVEGPGGKSKSISLTVTREN